MADNVFLRTPVENATAEGRDARIARGVAREKPETPLNPRTTIETAAATYKVPANLIMALGEASKFTPEQTAEAAEKIAERLAGPLSKGSKHSEAIRALLPDAPAGWEKTVVDRSNQLYDEIYAPKEPAAAPAPPAKVRGISLTDAMTYIDPFGTTQETMKGVARGVRGAIGAGAKALGFDETAKTNFEAAADPALAADVGSFRDVTNPRDAGKYLASLIGESAPEMAVVTGAGIAGSLTPAGPIGGIVTAMSTSALFNAGRNIERQEQENPGTAPNMIVAYGAGLVQGGLDSIVPGHAGGFVTRLVGAAGNSFMRLGKEVGEDVVQESITETVQQLIEIGQARPDLLRIMVAPGNEEEVKKSESLIEELVESAVGGAAAGGAISLAAAGVKSRGVPPIVEEAEVIDPAAPLPGEADPAIPSPADLVSDPGTQTGAVAPLAPAPVTTPAEARPGPLTAALQQGPAPLFPGLQPGTRISIEAEGISPIQATYLHDTAQGIRVKDDDGAELDIPREEIESGAARVTPETSLQNPQIAPEQAPAESQIVQDAKAALLAAQTPEEAQQRAADVVRAMGEAAPFEAEDRSAQALAAGATVEINGEVVQKPAPAAAADPYEAALAIVREADRASPSTIQRKLGLKYSEAQAILARMEAEGVIGPADNVGRRPVLKAEAPKVEEKPKAATLPASKPVEKMKQARTAVLQKRPFTYRLKATGIDPSSPLAAELNAADITPKTAPALFRRGGLRDVDNLPADDWRDIADQIGIDPATGYLDRQGVIDAIVRESAGEPVRSAEQAQMAEEQAMKEARATATQEIERWVSELGVALSAAEREEVMEAALGGDDVERVIERIAEREIEDAEELAGYEPQDIPGWEDRPAEPDSASGSRPVGPERLDQGEGEGAAGQGSSPRARSGTLENGAVDLTAEGEQTVIPGAERIPDRERAEREMAKPKRGGDKAPGGMFDENARNQMDLLDAAPKVAEKAQKYAENIPENITAPVTTEKDASNQVEKIDTAAETPAPKIVQMREKAGRITGIDQEAADRLATELNIKLPADTKGGFTFSWKHADRIRAALGAPAATPEPPAAPAPKAGKEPKVWTPIGENADGNPLFEDQNGVRSFTRDGLRSGESVGVKPGGGVVIDKTRRDGRYQTAEERGTPKMAPLRPGYERVMIGGEPSTTTTRMLDDGSVITRTPLKTEVTNSQGKIVFVGAHDVDEAVVSKAIEPGRTLEPVKPQRRPSPPQIPPLAGMTPMGKTPEAESGDASLGSAPQDGAPTHAQLFGNGPETSTLRTKGFDALDRDAQGVVLSQVAAAINDVEVLRFVVESVPVAVMNVLVGSKVSAKRLTGNPTVLTHRLSVPSDEAVPMPVIDVINALSAAIEGRSADGTAKNPGLDSGASVADLPGDVDAAKEAGSADLWHGEIAGQEVTLNPNPSEAQKEAGNYRLGSIRLHGLDISIETAKGGTRAGTAPDGKKWSVKLAAHYGYVKRTEGADGDHVDVYIGDFPERDQAYVFDQFDPEKKDTTGNLVFDEHKIVVGAASMEDARRIYDAGFSDKSGPARRNHAMPFPLTVEEFKTWLETGDQTKPIEGWKAEPVAPAPKTPKPAKALSGRVYHGSPDAKIDTFRPGTFFATNAEQARIYAKDGTVYEADVSIKNPFVIETLDDFINDYQSLMPGLMNDLKEKGHDGILIRFYDEEVTGTEKPGSAWVPFSADQIKVVPAASRKPAYGAANKLVSADRAAELRERLKAKLRDQLNSGIDPEVMSMGAELAVFHIEAGARRFADFAKAIAEDMGTTPKKLRKYLRSWYNGARDMLEDSDLSIEGMDDADAVRVALKAIDAETEEGTDGVQGAVSESDAAAGAADVQRAAPAREDGRAPGGEGKGSRGNVRTPDGEGAKAPERTPRAGREDGGRKDRAGDDDRIPARVVEAANHVITPGGLDEGRGWKAKANDNIAAIETLHRLEAENRNATPQEQEALARYVGWGGLASVFPNDADGGAIGKGYEGVSARLKELLTPEEYATARRSTQYAHYTAEVVVRSMWDAARNLGFTGGRVFEPGMGVGNFAGMMPAEIAGATTYHGLELDPTTARIAKKLYPLHGVREADLTRTALPENAYDLVIGNPPFGDIAIQSDPKYPQGFLIHDYFFAKSLDAVRPGGLLMFVTSAGSLNKIDAKARKYLSERAEFVGAVRLPGDAFEKNAGTGVTTDIIVLRKFVPGEETGPEGSVSPWLETVSVTLKDRLGDNKTGAVSRYFVEHPDMVLGEEGFFDKLYPGRYGVRARPGANLAAELPIALAKLRPDVMKAAETAEERADVDFASTQRKEGSYYLGEGDKLMQHRSGVGVPVQNRGAGVKGGLSAADQEKVKALIPLRDALREVYAADLAQNVAAGDRARARLNAAYDVFHQQFGPINKAEFHYRRPNAMELEKARAEAREEAYYAGQPWDEGSFDVASLDRVDDEGKTIQAGVQASSRARVAARELAQARGEQWSEGDFDPDDQPDEVDVRRPNIRPFADDPENYRLRAIEHYDDETGEAKKSDVFYRNIISRETTPDIRGVDDAVLYVLNTLGRFDLDAVAAAAKMSQSETLEALGNRVYEVPGQRGTYQTSGEYLSGNVRKKLRDAKEAAAKDPSLQRNVDALAAVMPEELAPAQIAATMGMPWIPTDVMVDFAKHIGLGRITAHYTQRFALWGIEGNNQSAAATSDWGTSRVGAIEIMRAILNKSTIRVTDTVRDPSTGNKKEVFNAEQTEAALAKRDAMLTAFSDWVYTDEARADRLAEIYNEGYNSIVVRRYDGDYLSTPGISTAWKWRPHQKRVVARIIQSGNTYMAHAVGAGKTSAMIGAGMEMRRLGLVKKPMYVVPNHMLAQFTKEFYEQYPTARLMVADERQFHTDRRKQFVADAAVNDLDAIIITHSSFGLIPMSHEFMGGMTQAELQEYRAVLSQMPEGDNAARITRKKLEQQIERMEQRLAKRSSKKRDQVFTFEEMGVDFLFVDEAQEFRKLDFPTKMGSLKGIDPVGSDMAWDLYAKTQYLEQMNPGRSLALASGTPITNTMAELFTLSRYIQPGALAEKGLQHFDAWASAFGESKAVPELDAGGKYKMVTRFSKFVNLRALSSMVLQNVDVVTSKELEQYVTRPKLKGGKRTMHLAEPSPDFEAYQRELAARIALIEKRKGPPKPGDDIILSVINDGRHAAIDMRLADPSLIGQKQYGEPSKLEMLIGNVFDTWQATKNQPFHGVEAEGGYTAKPISHGPATQMVFANLGISGSRGFSVVKHLRAELIQRGVPRDQIAYIADFKTHVAKQRLFNDMNEGKIRILIGSVKKMGTGVNAQRRLAAIHNLDPLWFPSDDEQRNGRGLRQGNMNPELEINDYGLKGSYDSTMWQMMERKGRFIESFWAADGSISEMDDIGEADFYEQAKALSTADPRIIQLTEMKQDLERMERRATGFAQEQHALKRKIAWAKDDKATAERGLELVALDLAQRISTRGDEFKATVDGVEFTERKPAGEKIAGMIAKLTDAPKEQKVQLGMIGGFPIQFEMWKSHMKQGQWTYGFSTTVLRNGDRTTTFKMGDSALGGVRSIESILDGFEREQAYDQEKLARAESEIESFSARTGQTFPDLDKLDALDAEVKALTKAIYEASPTVVESTPPPARPAPVVQPKAPESAAPAALAVAKEERMMRSDAPARDPNEAFASEDELREHVAALPVIGGILERLMNGQRLRIEQTPPMRYGQTAAWTKLYPENKRIPAVITLFADNISPASAEGVILHEMFHAGVAPLVGDKVWQGLMGRLETALKAAEQRRDSGARGAASDAFWDAALARIPTDTPAEHRAEELAAYALEIQSQAPAGIREILDRLLGRLKAWLLTRFGHQFGTVTPNELRALAIGALKAGAIEGGGGPRGGTRQSVAAVKPKAMTAPNIPAVTDAQMAEMERGLIGNALTRAMEGGREGQISILGLVPGRPLFAELAKRMTQAQEYLDLKTRMSATRNEWHAKMDETAQAWRKIISTDGKANQQLMDLMHDATLAGMDPSKAYQSLLSEKDLAALRHGRGGAEALRIANVNAEKDRERKVAYAGLVERFKALPAPFRSMFEEVRDRYKELNTEFDKTLIENVDRSIAQGLAGAQAEHQKEMDRIRDEGLSGKERDDAIQAADKTLATVSYRHRANRRARMADLRAEFETKKVPDPYFPLARFGSYFVTTRDAETGEVLGFSTFESPKAQHAFAQEQRKNPDHKVDAGVLGQTSVRDMVDPKFVHAVEKILLDANVPDKVLDAVWQKWLHTMPDMSLRKSRIHRKGTPGFNSDAFRAFGHHMFHGAHQLARLQYAIPMQAALDLAATQADAQPDPVRAGLVIREMQRRHEYTMNPKGAWWSQIISSATFVYYLAVSPAAALVNLSQTVIMGIPILGAGYPELGVNGASRALTRALHDFTAETAKHAKEGRWGETASTTNSARLTETEREAMEEAYRRGIIDKSQAHDIAGVGETGVEYSAVRTKVMAAISWSFHHAERLNREVTFLAAYRMARASGLDNELAIQKAGELTWKTHFDYQNDSRPRIMQGNVARVFLTFKNYAFNLLYRLFRDTHQAINAKDPAERKEAIVQLAGITGMLFTSAGIRGVWGYGIVTMLLGIFFPGGSDDAEDEIKKAVVNTLGTQLGGLALNGIPGHLTGIDLSNRIGMPDLWFRSPDRVLEGEDAYNYWVGEFLGAGAGMVQRGFVGLDQMFGDGEWRRGLETMAPKFIRDMMRAQRFYQEGVTTMKGDSIIEELPSVDIFKQALGFTPAQVAEQYDRNRKLKNAEVRITEERSQIMADMANSIRRGEAPPDAMIERLLAFNAKYPTYPITRDSLRSSIQGRVRASARNEGGVILNPKLDQVLRDNAAPMVYR